MKAKFLAFASVLGIAVGCGGDGNTTTMAPPIKNLGNIPPSDAASGAPDGKSSGGENVMGPRRAEVDKKIAEIKESKSYSDELKKQLIDEVERTYKEAQGGIKPK